MEKVKQVIVMRKDLHMRAGKIAAQASHASLGAVLQLMEKTESVISNYDTYIGRSILYKKTDPIGRWLEGKFAKICLYVNSEKELMEIYKQAKKDKLNVCLITDAGDTEFHGIPTKTCLAIGPDFESKIDKITKSLKLL